MTDEEFAQLLDGLQHETYGVEFKSSGLLSDRHYAARIVRAMMAMGNRRGGGFVIVGVSERSDKTLEHTGMMPEAMETWDFDRLSGICSGYAEPSVEFVLEQHLYADRPFLVIAVREFDVVPIICKKECSTTRGDRQAIGTQDKILLRDGACYIRSRQKVASVEVSRFEDMRDLIELATDKRIRRFREQSVLAGYVASASEGREADTQLYDDELTGLL